MYASEGERDHSDTSSEDSAERSGAGDDDEDDGMQGSGDVEREEHGGRSQDEAHEAAPTTPGGARGAKSRDTMQAAGSGAAASGPAEDVTMAEAGSDAATPASSTAGSSGGKRRGKRGRADQPGSRDRGHMAKRARGPDEAQPTGDVP